jgi:hypothetical protein
VKREKMGQEKRVLEEYRSWQRDAASAAEMKAVFESTVFAGTPNTVSSHSDECCHFSWTH